MLRIRCYAFLRIAAFYHCCLDFLTRLNGTMIALSRFFMCVDVENSSFHYSAHVAQHMQKWNDASFCLKMLSLNGTRLQTDLQILPVCQLAGRHQFCSDSVWRSLARYYRWHQGYIVTKEFAFS